MDASTDQLRTLAAVIDHGTFDRAAAALHITPSAVSQRIKSLEEQSGRIVVRRSKPVQATEAGAVLLRLARQVRCSRPRQRPSWRATRAARRRPPRSRWS